MYSTVEKLKIYKEAFHGMFYKSLGLFENPHNPYNYVSYCFRFREAERKLKQIIREYDMLADQHWDKFRDDYFDELKKYKKSGSDEFTDWTMIEYL